MSSRREHLAMRRRIWAVCQLATPQEIRDGLSFYPGAWGLCRFFARIFGTTPRHVAGIYAALSPLNTWDTNVANIVDVLRFNQDPSAFEGRFLTGPFKGLTEEEAIAADPAEFDRLVEEILSGPEVRVNTTNKNREKALRIAAGEDPDDVLRGRKVLSFFRCLANPDDLSLPPAIDRHVFNLALGLHAPTKREQADIAHDPELYSRVEAAFVDMGRREGIGNRLASICWFVQRRLERTGQRAMPSHEHDDSEAAVGPGPVCCGRPMWGHGKLKPRSRRAGSPTCAALPETSVEKSAAAPVRIGGTGGIHLSEDGRRRWYCPHCRSTSIPAYCLRLVRTPSGWERRYSTQGLKLWRDEKGRTCITLPKLHPYANSAGYQRLARFLIAEELGYLPPPNQHTHHRNGLGDDSLSALELLDTQYHGQLHASALYVARSEDGRFRPIDDPSTCGGIFSWPRRGAVLGRSARQSDACL